MAMYRRAAFGLTAALTIGGLVAVSSQSAIADDSSVHIADTGIGIYPRTAPTFDSAHAAAAVSDGRAITPICRREGQEVSTDLGSSDIWLYDGAGFYPLAYTDGDIAGGATDLPPCDDGVSVPISPEVNVPVRYDRAAAVAYADAHWADGRRILFAPDCTVYTSDVLAAGGLPKTVEWTDGSTDANLVAGKVRSLGGLIPFPTKDYADANLLVHYLLDQGEATITPIDLGQNLVPGAEPGDVIAYSWDGAGITDELPPIDHLAVVVGDDGSQTKVDQHEGNAHFKGWNWSDEHDTWILDSEPAPAAYLVHIDY